MTDYEKGMFVMNFLKKLGISMINIGEAVEDKSLEKSYQVICENPNIKKDEFLKIMEIEEEDY